MDVLISCHKRKANLLKNPQRCRSTIGSAEGLQRGDSLAVDMQQPATQPKLSKQSRHPRTKTQGHLRQVISILRAIGVSWSPLDHVSDSDARHASARCACSHAASPPSSAPSLVCVSPEPLLWPRQHCTHRMSATKQVWNSGMATKATMATMKPACCGFSQSRAR